MKQPDCTNDFDFFQKAVSHITSSLDLAESMVSLFAYLENHFPLDGISLHQYSRKLSALKLLFLVTKDSFNYVESIMPLAPEHSKRMIYYESNEDPILVSDGVDELSVIRDHRRAISHLLPYKRCSYLIGIMHAGEKPIGHLCFIGSGFKCFTDEHVRKMRLLLSPFTLAMANMLQFKRVLDFQEKLYAEKSSLEEELRQLQAPPIIGENGGLLETMKVVEQLKGRETPVFIFGETGTGKELIADAVQKISPRANKPFIKINCGAIPDSLIVSELFGYEKGAFTGAARSHPGRFEQADGGTLFLDEVGELSPNAQVHLLRVLQNNVVERLGGKESIPVDVRIIAATNRNLETMLRNGEFREDLYYRLLVFPIHLPPLRKRTEDVPALVHYFIKRVCDRLNVSNRPTLHPDSIPVLKQYSWPGNVRELENMVERAVLMSSGKYLQLEKFLPQDPGWYISPGSEKGFLEKLIDQRIRAALEDVQLTEQRRREKNTTATEDPATIEPLDDVVRRSIKNALARCRGKVHGPRGAADLLGLNPSTLRNKMKRLGVSADDWR